MNAFCERMRDERGLTLTELLVTVAVLVLIAAVALPQFGAMKTRAYNAQALSNLEMLAKAEGRRRAGEGSYASCASATECAMTFPEMRVNPGVTISAAADDDGYVAAASHVNGDERYVWDSRLGGLQTADGGGSAPDPDKPDPDKPDPDKPDPDKPDPGKPDPGKPDPGKPDPGKPDPDKPDPAKPDNPGRLDGKG